MTAKVLSGLSFIAALLVICTGTLMYPWWIPALLSVGYILLRGVAEPILLIAGWFFAPAWAISIFVVTFLSGLMLGYWQGKQLEKQFPLDVASTLEKIRPLKPKD